MARINSIKVHRGIEVYTVSLVNTNPTKDVSSNCTVYDTNRHIHADYNCPTFVSTLGSTFCLGNHNVQFQEMALDYYYMLAVSSDI